MCQNTSFLRINNIPLFVYTTSCFPIYPLTRYLFHLLAIVNNSVWNTAYKYFFDTLLSFLLCMYTYYSLVWTVTTTYYRLCYSNNRNLFLTVCKATKFKFKEPTDCVPGQGSLPSSQKAVLLPGPHKERSSSLNFLQRR